MPTFTFKCKCGEIYKELAKADEKVNCPKCATSNVASLPSQSSTIVMETKDAYRGKQIKKGNEGQMRDRMRQHYDKYEVADVIDKHGLNDAIKHGDLKRAKKV